MFTYHLETTSRCSIVVSIPACHAGTVLEVKPGKGAYAAPHNDVVYASLTGYRCTIRPAADSSYQRPIVEVTGHKAHGPVPQLGSIVIAQVTKVMVRSASTHIVCVGHKSVREIFTGIISLGATMVPVNWMEMQCPLTSQIEQRKVAKMAS